MSYIWEHKNWPNFQYDLGGIQDVLYRYALESGALTGGLENLPTSARQDALIDLMTLEALKTSEIEGELFDPRDVQSSLLNQLGLATLPIKNLGAVGIAELMISNRKTFEEPLSEEQLFAWHKMVMAASPSYLSLEIGKWRTALAPMQIVSGAMGREIVHYEAPPSSCVPFEMARFIQWFNDSRGQFPGPVRAAIAHLYFECIHPFADGNGRIGRAIAEKALSQDLKSPVLLSLSPLIVKNKKLYYQELSAASGDTLEITHWITYFVTLVYEAQLAAKELILFFFKKAKFWLHHANHVNERQEKVLHRIFQAGVDGFEGGINAQKYMRITGCSKATATRDLADLLQKGCLIQLPGGGRNVRYDVDWEKTST